jgi:hypothetical protein
MNLAHNNECSKVKIVIDMIIIDKRLIYGCPGQAGFSDPSNSP